ncbi:MAG: triose-phosphate isomerase [Ignavibacteria bacterium]|nr:MAG: triose-phosphate isomerase [Ignavibacteria bacterium]
MRPYVVAGNWKMNTDMDSAIALAEALRARVDALEPGAQVQVLLCPPYPMLASVAAAVKGSPIGVGAQNMYLEDSGAYTGEVSAAMLVSAGCSHVILGHSERRQYFDDSNAVVNAKVKKAFTGGLVPIMCVGETLEQRETGVTEAVITMQIREGLEGVTAEQVRTMVVAYEPVWAIGTGRTATPEQAQEVHVYIRDLVATMYDRETADALVLQYGGSVKADNAAELFAQPDVDGGLIGGASLKAEQFLEIISAAKARTAAHP